MQPGDLRELDHPDSAWNRAAAESEAGDAFCCRTEWQISFHEAFYPDRTLHVAQGGGSVVAFAERRHPRLGLLLEPIESHWLFGCPLLGGAGSVDLLRSLLAEHAAKSGPSTVVLSGLAPRSELFDRIVETFESRQRILRLQPQTLCTASLAGGLDGFLSRRSSSLRRNLRQAGRRAAASGVYFERRAPGCAAESQEIYARMLEVEESSWKGLGECGMAEPPSRQFYGIMLQRLAASGGGRVTFARHADEDIGFIFGGLAGNVYRGQQFSFAEDWRSHSIGNLLQLEQIRWLCEGGVEHYDMGPLMDYKPHWAESQKTLEALLLLPAGLSVRR